MAVIQFTSDQHVRNAKITWSGLASGDTGNPFEISGSQGAYSGVQISGTFNTTTVVLQGSNDGTNWSTVDDRAGNAVSATAAGIFDVVLPYLYIRPSVSGGTGDSINVTVVLRG